MPIIKQAGSSGDLIKSLVNKLDLDLGESFLHPTRRQLLLGRPYDPPGERVK